MTTAPPTDQNPRRRRLLIGIALLALIIAVIVIVIIAASGSKGDGSTPPTPDQRDQAAIAYVNAINAGDPEAVCRLETARQRGDDSLAECAEDRKYLRDRNVKADEPKVIRSRQLAEGTGVLVEYHLTTGGDTPSHDALRMLQQPDGAWLIDQAESADAATMATDDPILTALGERRAAQ
ncbi:hypothetical protein ACQPXM_41180 (plasmid) [Kribbella sp. CA-253562]|uniref:hypothetical protein n=1 Tax=Kribbella sp. CA-253562 TaxID=3239942 RepID=UPI003D8B97B7